MAGPKASSASSEQQHGQKDKQQGSKPDPISYKSKFLAPSDHDDLSHPSETADQDTNKPKLPPVKDEGSPPMVPDTPAGDSQTPSTPDQSTEPIADKDGFIPVTKHAQQAADTSGADDDGAAGKDTGMETGAGAVPSEVVSQDTPAGVTLSDVDKETLADESTADLVAAATGASPPSNTTPTEDAPTAAAAAAAAANEDTSPAQAAPAAATGAQLLPDTDTNQLAKGGTAATGSSGSSGVTSDTSSSGQGAKGASAGAAADDSSYDSSLPTPAAAQKMAGEEETMSPAAAAAVDDGRAKAAAAAELPEQGGEGLAITPADFAATGLAALEAEADAAAAAKKSRGGSGGSGGWGGGDRSMSVMTDRTDSGWYDRSYSSMLPSSAVELAGMDQPSAMEPLSEKSEEPFSEDGDSSRLKSEDSTQPQSESNVSKAVSPVQRYPQSEKSQDESASADAPPQHYPALAQAPGVSDDPAAVPAGQSTDTAAAAVGGSGERVFAGQGSGKESGRGGVIVSAADLSDEAGIQVLGDKDVEDLLSEGGEGGKSSAAAAEGGGGAPVSSADVSAAADKSKGLLSSDATPAAGEATTASAVAPYMPSAETPAGEAADGEGEDLSKAAAVDALPFPLKVFDNAAKSVIDTVADAAEAVKDTLLGPDIEV